jgi:MSHA biogenesis protein MshI
MPEGIGIARIARDAQGVPRLLLCRFEEVAQQDARAAALQALVKALDLKGAACVSVMPAGGFTLLLLNAPEVEPDELKAAVRWRIRDLIDFHIDDAVVDVFDIPGQQERGRPKMMYVVAAHASAVQEHIGLIEGSGLDLKAIDIPELVHRNLAAQLPEDPSGVALLHLSRRSGLLTLTRDKTLYLARSLDLGVEQLAAEAGSGEQADGPPEALQRLLDGIVLEVQRSLDYYESHFSLPPVGTLVIAPLERDVPGLLSYVADNLGVGVRMLDVNAVVDSPAAPGDADQARCLAAIGAALRIEETAP